MLSAVWLIRTVFPLFGITLSAEAERLMTLAWMLGSLGLTN